MPQITASEPSGLDSFSSRFNEAVAPRHGSQRPTGIAEEVEEASMRPRHHATDHSRLDDQVHARCSASNETVASRHGSPATPKMIVLSTSSLQ